jgi:nitrite reductase/ring-hydroxylating ferredoxin subunit
LVINNGTRSSIDAGSWLELRDRGFIITKLAGLPVLVVHSEGEVFAVEDRCPHLGFPLHRGTVESGMVTCHWHHARFDLSSGCALDPWADDAKGFDVAIEGERVIVTERDAVDLMTRAAQRLREGLEQGLPLVVAKSVVALSGREGGERVALQTAFDFGLTYRGSGWGAGLTVLTCVANLLDSLHDRDRALALVHAVTFLGRDTLGNPPRFAMHGLDVAGQAPDRLAGWFRRFVETRSADGAERTLATALAAGFIDDAEQMLLAACTDHVMIDGGHTLDFANKAMEMLDHLGRDDASALGSLVTQLCEAHRAEESSAWTHPDDLAALAREAVEQLPTPGPGGGDIEGLAWTVLESPPDVIVEVLRQALSSSTSAEELARAVAYAAALRLVRFHLSNDPGDWDTVHHTFTFANAVHQAVVRHPTSDVLRGAFHAALSVHLDRFLNIPPARMPTSVTGSLESLGSTWDVQGRVDEAAAEVNGFLAAGGDRGAVVAALAHALFREDADFHAYQILEAGVRQAHAWPDGSEPSRLILVGVTRFLAAHSPTRRELLQVVTTAQRMQRGEELFVETPGSGDSASD